MLYYVLPDSILVPGTTTNSRLSSRLDSLRSDHSEKHDSHARILDDLTSSHRSLRGRVEGVAGDLVGS